MSLPAGGGVERDRPNRLRPYARCAQAPSRVRPLGWSTARAGFLKAAARWLVPLDRRRARSSIAPVVGWIGRLGMLVGAADAS